MILFWLKELDYDLMFKWQIGLLLTRNNLWYWDHWRVQNKITEIGKKNEKHIIKTYALTQDRTTDLQFTRLTLYHWAIGATCYSSFVFNILLLIEIHAFGTFQIRKITNLLFSILIRIIFNYIFHESDITTGPNMHPKK